MVHFPPNAALPARGHAARTHTRCHHETPPPIPRTAGHSPLACRAASAVRGGRRMTATPSPNGQRRRPGRRDPREGLDSNVAPDVAGLPARLVMEAIPDMAALCDADGTVTYVNPALAALLWEVGPSGAAPDSLALAARA